MVDFDNLHNDNVKEKLLHKTESLKHRSERHFSSNFGMIASLGGVIIVPILIGIYLGDYLEKAIPQRFSWRLSLIFFGFIWGIANAYWWIKNEDRKIKQNTLAEKQERAKNE